MKTKIFAMLFTMTIFGINSLFSQTAVVPKPAVFKCLDGSFVIDKTTVIIVDDKSEKMANTLADMLKPAFGFSLKIVNDSTSKKIISLKINHDLNLPKEGYRLTVTTRAISIIAKDEAGLFYGCQTLRQLLPVEIFATKLTKNRVWQIECVKIEDYPQYPWRGLMLDVSRYFMDTEYVKHYIDIMAMHKLNVLHLHLIDDAGWRIEIKKYPKLTTVGGWRGSGKDRRNGGFYTQKELKDIVKYAADRHIEIVPEIELPAHTLSALAAYPYLGCRQIAHKVPSRHFISRDLYCAGRDSTYKFLEDVMKEVFEIFPGKYIHVGGDEARYDQWRKCKYCQAKKKKEGLKTEKELQGFMTRFFENLCKKENRQIIGWDEILTCNVSKSAALMVWHNTKHALEGAKLGHPVVAAYVRHTYFDTPESRLPGEIIGTGWTPPVTLEKSYNWDPRPAGLTDEEAKNILGGHGCLWTDQFLHKVILRDKPNAGDKQSQIYVDKLTLPRVAGLAETNWTSAKNKDFDDFKVRMQTHLLRYELQGWSYRLPLPTLKYAYTNNGVKVSATTSIKGGKIYYTTNNDQPTINSKCYKNPVIVKRVSDFKAIVVSPQNVKSLVANKVDKSAKYNKYGKELGVWKSGKVGNRTAKEVSFDATGLIDRNGTYEVTFIYTKGKERLDIDYIKLYKNGNFITKDEHHGFTGGRSQKNVYTLKVADYETGAAFKIKAGIYGDEGNDSNGIVLIKRVK